MYGTFDYYSRRGCIIVEYYIIAICHYTRFSLIEEVLTYSLLPSIIAGCTVPCYFACRTHILNNEQQLAFLIVQRSLDSTTRTLNQQVGYVASNRTDST